MNRQGAKVAKSKHGGARARPSSAISFAASRAQRTKAFTVMA